MEGRISLWSFWEWWRSVLGRLGREWRDLRFLRWRRRGRDPERQIPFAQLRAGSLRACARFGMTKWVWAFALLGMTRLIWAFAGVGMTATENTREVGMP